MRTERHISECSSTCSWSRSGVTGSVTAPLCWSAVQLRKALGLVLDLSPRRRIEPSERLPADAAVVEPPRARNRAVDEEGSDRLRHRRREDPRTGAPPRGRRSAAHGRGAPRPRSAGSAPEPASPDRAAERAEGRGARRRIRHGSAAASVARVRASTSPTRMPGPLRDVGARRRPERGRGSGERGGRARRPLRRPPARPSALPSGRGARVASPTCRTAGRARARATAPTIPQPRPTTSTSSSWRRGPSAMSASSRDACRSRSRSFGRRLLHAQPPVALRIANRDRERPVVAARDDVDRRAHERRLDDRPALERPREIVAAEALEARPQPDVRVRRVLILDPADPLERARDRYAHALEQELASEQRSVQLALREHAVGHGRP